METKNKQGGNHKKQPIEKDSSGSQNGSIAKAADFFGEG